MPKTVLAQRSLLQPCSTSGEASNEQAEVPQLLIMGWTLVAEIIPQHVLVTQAT